jgi:stringent starvation protein B
MLDAKDSSSTRPYLIRALYEWCTDNGFTPYVAVLVDDTVRVPNEYVKDGEIVLNISFDATSSLKLGNEFIEFKARFAGSAREIMVPINRVIAIYARENGQGMAFPMSVPTAARPEGQTPALAAVHEVRPGTVAGAGSGSGAGQKVVHLIGDSHAATNTGGAAAADGDAPPPAAPKPPGGPRPALKRVK